MREIVLDTETTGLDPNHGDRIVEIGAVELWNHIPTGKTYHQYINPERTMPKEAFQVHGLGDDFLRDKPVFASIAADFGEFIWQRILDVGKAYNIRPYGTEAMGIMRIEKGHVAGPELDGRTTATDLGLQKLLSSKKDFLNSSC